MIWITILNVIWRLEAWALSHIGVGETKGGDVIWLPLQAK